MGVNMSNTKNYNRLKAMRGYKSLPNDPAGEAYQQGMIAQNNQKLVMKNTKLADANVMRAAQNKMPKRGPVYPTNGSKAGRALNYDALKALMESCSHPMGEKGGVGSGIAGHSTQIAPKVGESNIPKPIVNNLKTPYTRNYAFL